MTLSKHTTLWLLFAILALPGVGSAQEDFPNLKVHAGISYANIDIEGMLDRQNALGWAASLNARFHRNFGVTFDFAGQYDPDCAENDEDCLIDLLLSERVQNYNSHQFLVGPSVTIPRGNWDFFAHALFGGVSTKAETIILDTGEEFEVTSGARFAMAFGGGVDWMIIPNIGLRIVEVDFIPVKGEEQWRNNIRIQGGFLFAW